MNIRYNTEKHTSSLLFCFFFLFLFFSYTVWAGTYSPPMEVRRLVSRVSFSLPPFCPRSRIKLSDFGTRKGLYQFARTHVARLALKSRCSGYQWPWTLNHLASTSQGLEQYLWATTTLGIDPFNLKYSRNGLGVQVKKKRFCIRTPKISMYTRPKRCTISMHLETPNTRVRNAIS